MDIRKCTNAINAYQSIGETKITPADKKAEGIKKVNNIEGSKASIVKSANAPASAERIAALKAQVQEGKYNVSSEAIARAMLSVEA